MITHQTHEAYASVIGDNAEFELVWYRPHDFNLLTKGKHKRGVRGFPICATAHEGVVYVWPINDGSAKVWWRPRTWRKPT